MQPEINQAPQIGPENTPLPPVPGVEQVPTLPPLDSRFEAGADRVEQVAEARAIVGNIPTPTQPVTGISPQEAPSTTIPQPSAAVNGPVTAADEDLIEKEWIDKAKSIVATTKDDPNARSAQINMLKIDYKKKRYGKDIGSGL